MAEQIVETVLGRLRGLGYDVKYTSHAEAILTNDFNDAFRDVGDVLSVFSIAVEEIVRGGGGEAYERSC